MILYNFASRSRPHKLVDAIENIYAMSKSNSFKIVLSLDLDDNSVNNPMIRQQLCTFSSVSIAWGYSSSKIHAINRTYSSWPRDWDILVNMSDDMEFITKDFDQTIKDNFNEDFDQFHHYNDGNQKDRVCTLSIMGKYYFDRFGYIYHPAYTSLWCDCEATEVAKLLGKYKYFGDSEQLFKHNHPAFGLTTYDEQYKATEAPDVWAKDEAVYNQRKQNNFYVDANR